MKLNDLAGHLVAMLDLPMSEFTELQRALKEQSSHFDEDAVPDKWKGFDPEVLRSRPGPKGGVDADPFRAAFFLLGVALNGPRKDIAQRTWMAWHLTQEGSKHGGFGDDLHGHFPPCPFTGHNLFGEALRAILSEGSLACVVTELRIEGDDYAEIHYHDQDSNSVKTSRFGEVGTKRLRRIAVLDGSVLQAVQMLISRDR